MGGQRPRDPAETEKGEGVTRNREKGRQGVGQRSKGARSPGKGEGSEAGTRDSNETTDTDVGGKQGEQGGGPGPQKWGARRTRRDSDSGQI